MQHLPFPFLLAMFHHFPSCATPLPINLFHMWSIPKRLLEPHFKCMFPLVQEPQVVLTSTSQIPGRKWRGRTSDYSQKGCPISSMFCAPLALLTAKVHFPTYMNDWLGPATGISLCHLPDSLLLVYIPLPQNPACNSPPGNLGLTYR